MMPMLIILSKCFVILIVSTGMSPTVMKVKNRMTTMDGMLIPNDSLKYIGRNVPDNEVVKKNNETVIASNLVELSSDDMRP